MNPQNYSRLAAVIFAIIALLQLVHLVSAWDIALERGGGSSLCKRGMACGLAVRRHRRYGRNWALSTVLIASARSLMPPDASTAARPIHRQNIRYSKIITEMGTPMSQRMSAGMQVIPPIAC
jgi:hypothetical protein